MKGSNKVKKFILDNLTLHKRNIIRTAIIKFGISRQAVLKHMNTLISEKKVIAHGKTRDRFYELRPEVNFSKTIDLSKEYAYGEIINNQIIPQLSILTKNIQEICEFSISAILNNIYDHSKATSFYFKLYFNYKDIQIVVSDNGEGLFKYIQTKLKLKNPQMAALEIAKGGLTTDPKNHSGEELYTLINLFDQVAIDSTGISLKFDNKTHSWMIDRSIHKNGTRIQLKIKPSSRRTCKEVFHRLFKSERKSVSIPVSLLKIHNAQIVNSRQQAQNMLRNISDLKTIEFDFKNIDLIGPAFADELVRKTKVENSSANIKWINSNETVDVLMKRALTRFS